MREVKETMLKPGGLPDRRKEEGHVAKMQGTLNPLPYMVTTKILVEFKDQRGRFRLEGQGL